MKKFTLLTFILFTVNVFAQNVPIDFETGGNGADWTWTTFENDDNPALEIIANPFSSGINTSATVAKFTARSTGQPFAGCESMHGSDIGTFMIDPNESTITIMVYKSVISDVGIKLVTESGAALPEVKVPNTKVNEWEMLSFDFSGQTTMEYDQIVIFMDFNDRTEETVNYFDNITIGGQTASTADLSEYSFDLYPNPATNEVNIHLTPEMGNTGVIEVFGLQGQLVESQDIAPTAVQKLSVSDLETGVYWIKIKTNVGVFTRQIKVD